MTSTVRETRAYATTETILQRAGGDALWVEAAPFRAQLVLVLETSRLPLPHLAVHLGLPTSALLRLLGGRDGLRQRRISPVVAAALIRHTPSAVAEAAGRRVSAHDARQQLRGLIAAGWPTVTLARVGGIGHHSVQGIADGTITQCTLRLELAVRALQLWAETRTPAGSHAPRVLPSRLLPSRRRAAQAARAA